MEKRAIANTSSLVFIAKLDIFNLAKNLFSEVIVPKEVLNEIFEKDFPENNIVKKELGKFLKEVKVKKIKEFNLDKGEQAAVSLCLEKNIETFVSDDKKARRYAKSLGIETVGIIGILLFNLKNKKIKKQDFLRFFKKLIDNNYYISSRLYAEVMDLVDNF